MSTSEPPTDRRPMSSGWDDTTPRPSARGPVTRRIVAGLAAAAAVWALLYAVNERLWDVVVFDLVGPDQTTRLGSAIHFFLYDTAKISLLITGLIFAISLARS